MNQGKVLFLVVIAQLNLGLYANETDKDTDIIKAEATEIKLDIVTSDLKIPWSFAFLTDNTALVGERELGQLSVLNLQNGTRTLVEGLPQMLRSKKVSAGLFDVALHPRYEQNSWLYLVHAVGSEEANGLAISRGKFVGNQISQLETLFETKTKISGKWHFGGRLVLTAKHLFLSTGDGYDHSALSQDLDSHAGKIVRLNLDGSIPTDNPFVNKSDALPEIWSYGVRNPQAMTLHPITGEVWQIEHGPQGGDEINIAQAGKNYGWPIITYGEEYGGGPIGAGITHHQGMEQPVYYWLPSIAPSGATFYTGNAFPRWQGNLFVGALAGKHLSRLVIENNRVIHEERLLEDKKWRVRFVVQGPDSNLYIGVDAGHVIRISPANKTN